MAIFSEDRIESFTVWQKEANFEVNKIGFLFLVLLKCVPSLKSVTKMQHDLVQTWAESTDRLMDRWTDWGIQHTTPQLHGGGIMTVNTLRPRQNGRHFPDDIFKCIFFWMKMHEFRLIFHLGFFLRVQLTIFQYWFRQWLGADQATTIIGTNDGQVYWGIYASLSLNELNGKQWNIWKIYFYQTCFSALIIFQLIEAWWGIHVSAS